MNKLLSSVKHAIAQTRTSIIQLCGTVNTLDVARGGNGRKVAKDDFLESLAEINTYIEGEPERLAAQEKAIEARVKKSVEKAVNNWLAEEFDEDMLNSMTKAKIIAQASGYFTSLQVTLAQEIEDAEIDPE